MAPSKRERESIDQSIAKLGQRSRSWLGLDDGPVAGLTFDDAAVSIALVRADRRLVVGVSRVMLRSGIVVGDRIVQQDQLTLAIREARRNLGLTRSPVGFALPTGDTDEHDHHIRFARRLTFVGSAGIAPLIGSAYEAPAEAMTAVDDAGLLIRSAEPVVSSLARVVAMASAADESIDCVANCGWTSALYSLTPHSIEGLFRRRSGFANGQDIRRGRTKTDPGVNIDPFTWPRRLKPFSSLALVAAAAALGPALDS